MSALQNVTGLAELQQFLDQLPVKLQRNVLRGAMRAGAKVQRAAALERVSAETAGPHPGALRDSIRISTSVRGGVIKAIVTAGGKVRGGVNVFWAWWVEAGTAAHFIKPKNRKSLFFAGLAAEVVNHPGAKPKPFMRPALDTTVNAAVTAVGEYIRARLTKAGIDVPGPENF